MKAIPQTPSEKCFLIWLNPHPQLSRLVVVSSVANFYVSCITQPRGSTHDTHNLASDKSGEHTDVRTTMQTLKTHAPRFF